MMVSHSVPVSKSTPTGTRRLWLGLLFRLLPQFLPALQLRDTGVLLPTFCHRRTPLGTMQEWNGLQNWLHSIPNAFPGVVLDPRTISRTGGYEAMSELSD